MKKIFWKISLTYLGALFVVNFLRIGIIDELFLSNIPKTFLLIINVVLFLVGIPIPLVLDIVLINNYDIFYLVLFPFLIGIISSFHVYFFRKKKLQFILWDNLTKYDRSRKWISNFKVRINSFKIFLIRSLPIFPFLFGNYIISSSRINIYKIFGLNLLGSYFYYISLYIVIKLSF